MFCKNCGTQLPDDANVCTQCGTPTGNQESNQQNAYQTPPPQYQQPPYPQNNPDAKSKLVAGLLNIFIPIGIGRFYLGYTNLGMAQLLVGLFTCGAGGLWSIIDGIMIITGSVKTDANGVPLKD